MHQDQQPIPAHSNNHYYYVRNFLYSGNENITRHKFTFLHLSSAIKYAKNKTVPVIIFNQDGIVVANFSKIHEF